ncbi:hypothetical protein J2755_000363 [Methanohalophilus levihalophilus]|uniref:hypothetical protein n=1 Tax=Methanohalophilus levihalophilus TaxID=1431282 RepID=UPI001AE1D3E7|nr:hypothetical protein [Methanohalophilus levihalophilus]MBP2029443.1 hypothetical protein [Methanohalophilus levihalophilus]
MVMQVALSILIIIGGCGLCTADCQEDPDEDIQWDDEGSVTVKWGQTERISVNGISYIIKAEDFGPGLEPESVSISVANEETGVVEHAILFLNNYNYRTAEYDYELKLYLKEIKVDSDKTPSATFEYDRRGIPELEVKIEASSEEFGEIDVSSEQYAPDEEKDFDIKIRNKGSARIFDVELRIDPGEFTITEKNEFNKEGSELTMDFNCINADEDLTFNFTARAPEWDGSTSPYNLNYTIHVLADGRDILDYNYDFKDNITLRATDPELNVVQRVYARSFNYANESNECRAEIDLSPWYIEGGNPEDLWDYVTVHGGVFSTGLYTVRNVEELQSELPEELVAVEVTGDGSPDYISPDSPYSFSYKLMPTAPGTYTLKPFETRVDFFGKDFNWKSDNSIKIIVHGPDISLSKTLEIQDDSYLVKVNVENVGDRAAWINVSDSVPEECNYVDGSLEESIEDSSLPLDEWEINVHNNGSCSMSVEGVFLPPSTSLGFSYELNSGEIESLPYAQAEFRARNLYWGYVRSDYYENGQWVSQHWDRFLGEWVFDLPAEIHDEAQNSEMGVEEDSEETTEGSAIDPSIVLASTAVTGTAGAVENESRAQMTGFMDFFDGIIDSIIGVILGTTSEVGGAMGNAGDAIGTIAEDSFHVVAIIVVVVGFLVGTFLLKK